jgi:hypothetical protein
MLNKRYSGNSKSVFHFRPELLLLNSYFQLLREPSEEQKIKSSNKTIKLGKQRHRALGKIARALFELPNLLLFK